MDQLVNFYSLFDMFWLNKVDYLSDHKILSVIFQRPNRLDLEGIIKEL
jgi:hypothetical protein